MTAVGVVMGPAQSWATMLIVLGLPAALIACAILRRVGK